MLQRVPRIANRTLDPCRTGLTTSGNRKCSGIGVCAADATEKLAVRYAGLGAQRCLVRTLSKAIRLAAASQPV